MKQLEFRPLPWAMAAILFSLDAQAENIEPAADTGPLLFTYTKADIQRTGWVTLADVLNELVVTGTTETRAMTAFSTGANRVNLRSFGESRGLVLLNGRRLVLGLDGAADLTTIPLSAIDRIEISTEGGSAAHGSGAISGVINLVTNESFQGLSAALHVGEFSDGDGESRAVDFSFGTGPGARSVSVHASFSDANPVLGSSRPISSQLFFGTDTALGSSFTPQGRFGSSVLGSFNLTSVPGTEVTSPSDFNEGDFVFGSPGMGTDRFNSSADQFVLNPQQRASLMAQGRFEFGGGVLLEVEGLYSERDASLQLAPPALALGLFGPFPNIGVAADNSFNVFGQELAGSDFLGARRLVEAGPRTIAQDVDEYRFAAALSGHLGDEANAYYWQVDLVHSRRRQREAENNRIDNERVRRSLSGQPCRDDLFGDGCVELNIFGGQGADGNGTITGQMLDYILFDSVERGRSELDLLTGRVGGNIANFPAGPVALTAGVEFRREGGEFSPFLSPEVQALTLQQDTNGDVTAREFWVGLDVPLHNSLTASLEGRYSDLDSVDSLSAGKARLQWQPSETTRIWGVWSKDFRAPTVTELFGRQSFGNAFYSDPCILQDTDSDAVRDSLSLLPGCAEVDPSSRQEVSMPQPVVGSDESVDPETSDQWNVGFSWQPVNWTKLNARVQFNHIELDDRIVTLSAQSLLNACAYLLRHCDRIQRSTAGQSFAAGDLVNIFGGVINDGKLDASTIDLGLNWSDESDSWFVDWAVSYTQEFERTDSVYQTAFRAPTLNTPTETAQLLGQAGALVIPRWKSALDLRWEGGRWAASWGVRYTHGSNELCSLSAFGLCNVDLDGDGNADDGRHIGATTYHDVQVTYRLLENDFQLVAGIQNLFDKGPPLSTQIAGSSYHPNDYRTPGRYPYLRLALNF